MLLDFMRREKKKVLGLFLVPLIFGLVAYLIPGIGSGGWGRKMNDSVLAQVGSAEISAVSFTTAYHRFLRNNKIPYDGKFLKQLHFDQQILNQLISKELILAEAKRLGIVASPQEIREKIVAIPYFSENGNFQYDRYEAILRQQNMTPPEFEDELKYEIVQTRLHGLITDSIAVSDKEVEEEYKVRNEKVKVSYAVFEPSQFGGAIVPVEAELTSFFNSSRENYRVPEQRKVKNLLISTARLRDSAQIAETDVKSYYQQNIQTYNLPEKVRASHILFKTEGKSPEEVNKIRAKATEVLMQIKSGADFASMAKKYSEDASASQGGDLGFFGRGQMVPPFEKTAFSLGIGTVSDLVTTQFGFHIIKALEKQAARTQKFEEVANLIRPTLVQRQAEQLAQDLSDRAYSRIKSNQTLDQIATELKLEIHETPFFAQGTDVPMVGNTPDFSSKVFGLKPKEITSPVRIPSGYVIAQLLEIKAPYLPELAEVRPKVEQDFKAVKSVEVARNKAKDFASKVKSGANFDATAKAFGVTVKNSDSFARKGSLPDLGSTEPIDGFAFAGKVGDISQPISVGQKQVILQLKEKIAMNPESFAKEKNSLSGTLESQRKDQVFQAYLDEAKNRLMKTGKIKINQKTFEDISRRL